MTVTAQPCWGESVQVGGDVIVRPSPTVQVTVPAGLNPDTAAMQVMDEPMARLMRGQFTDVVVGVAILIVTGLEVTVFGIGALSVTWSSKLHVPATDSVPVDTVG